MKGKVWPAEWREHRDAISGLRVRQWTCYKGHSHHLYFTNPGWYDGVRRLLFASDRNNLTQLFSLDGETGEILQLTERIPPAGKEVSFLSTSLNPQRPEAYFWYLGELVALDLRTLEERTLHRAPEGFRTSITNCTAAVLNNLWLGCYNGSKGLAMTEKRNWKEYDEHFVQTGEDTHRSREPMMNMKKNARPFRYPRSRAV